MKTSSTSENPNGTEPYLSFPLVVQLGQKKKSFDSVVMCFFQSSRATFPGKLEVKTMTFALLGYAVDN